MRTVCVIGEGTAGVEAALEAARSGCQVTLLERSSRTPLPKSMWPEIIEGNEPRNERCGLLVPLGVEVVFGANVTSVGPGPKVRTPSGSAVFDSVVIATGSRPVVRPIPGSRRPGVNLLAASTDYMELAEAHGAQKIVVAGGGVQAFQVADKLSRKGGMVTILGRGQRGRLSPVLGELLEASATNAGIRVLGSHLQKAAGSRSVEAVVAGGKVFLCDLLVLIPERCADLPQGVPQAGPGGMVLVDSTMGTPVPGVYAAGSCAGLRIPGWPHGPLVSSGAGSGKVAGANSAARHVSFRPASAFTADAFGISFQGAGMTWHEARMAGLDALESVSAAPSSACSLVYERTTRRILGAQSAGAPSRGNLGLLGVLVSERATLDALAYSDLGSSTDISLLQDTARQVPGLELNLPR